MGPQTIIFDIILFTSYLANIFFIIWKCIKIPQGLKTLEEDCIGLNNHETVALHHKRFISQFFQILWGNMLFMIIGAVTCVNDGLSDMENLIVVPILTIFFVGTLLSGFFIAYTHILRRTYSIQMAYKDDGVSTRGYPSGAQAGACMLASDIFGFNTGFVTYTIALLLLL